MFRQQAKASTNIVADLKRIDHPIRYVAAKSVKSQVMLNHFRLDPQIEVPEGVFGGISDSSFAVRADISNSKSRSYVERSRDNVGEFMRESPI